MSSPYSIMIKTKLNEARIALSGVFSGFRKVFNVSELVVILQML